MLFKEDYLLELYKKIRSNCCHLAELVFLIGTQSVCNHLLFGTKRKLLGVNHRDVAAFDVSRLQNRIVSSY